jgi:hypothetical protein
MVLIKREHAVSNNPTRLISWSPLEGSRSVYMVAIRCHPNQKLDSDTYMYLLSKRVQHMVDESGDPSEAVAALQEEMFRSGLVSEVGFCPVDEAGNRLVWSNPAVEEKLSNLGAFELLRTAQQPLIENLMAHQALVSDRENPIDNLTLWASQIGAVP